MIVGAWYVFRGTRAAAIVIPNINQNPNIDINNMPFIRPRPDSMRIATNMAHSDQTLHTMMNTTTVSTDNPGGAMISDIIPSSMIEPAKQLKANEPKREPFDFNCSISRAP